MAFTTSSLQWLLIAKLYHSLHSCYSCSWEESQESHVDVWSWLSAHREARSEWPRSHLTLRQAETGTKFTFLDLPRSQSVTGLSSLSGAEHIFFIREHTSIEQIQLQTKYSTLQWLFQHVWVIVQESSTLRTGHLPDNSISSSDVPHQHRIATLAARRKNCRNMKSHIEGESIDSHVVITPEP